MAGWFFRPFRSENNRMHTFHSSHQTHTKTVFFLSFQVRAITPVWAKGAVLTGLSPQCGARELYWQGYHPSVGPRSCTDRAITPVWAQGAVLTGLLPQCGLRADMAITPVWAHEAVLAVWAITPVWAQGAVLTVKDISPVWAQGAVLTGLSPQCGPRELYRQGYHPSVVGPGSCTDRAITPVWWAQGAVLTGLSPQCGGPRELYWQGYHPSVVGPGSCIDRAITPVWWAQGDDWCELFGCAGPASLWVSRPTPLPASGSNMPRESQVFNLCDHS